MGSGVGIVKVAAPVLIQEIAHPRLRATLGSCYQTFAYLGIFFAALMTCKSKNPLAIVARTDLLISCRIVRSWQLGLAISFPSPDCGPGDGNGRCIFLPRISSCELPFGLISILTHIDIGVQWLIRHGRTDEAHAVLARLHANGNCDDALVMLEMREIAAGIEREINQRKTSYLDFLRTPGNRRRLVTIFALACSLNWMGNGIIT